MEGTQEGTQETRRINKWEALGRMYVQTDIHHSLQGLKDRIKQQPGMSPYNIAWVVNGYLDAVLEGKDHLRAYAIMQDGWAGLIIDGGTAYLNSCRIKDAETGIYIIKGVLEIKDSVISENVYGIEAILTAY
ncbi:hypothetical protein HZB90_02630 [archaeon]|nr:hypothetical protein [archaeon]